MIILPIDTDIILKGHVRGFTRRNGSAVNPHWRRAAHFAAKKHKGQKRSNGKTPYIAHPIAVAKILHDEAGIKDDATIIASLMHDTIEDTNTTREEIAELFGNEVASIVAEVSNPPGIGANKHQWQIDHAKELSDKAASLKVADKIANLRDIVNDPPVWDQQKKMDYYDHANMMVDAIEKPHPILRDLFKKQYSEGRKKIGQP